MTEFEHFMLSVVYGGTLGWVVAGIILLIICKLDDIKRKRRPKKEQPGNE